MNKLESSGSQGEIENTQEMLVANRDTRSCAPFALKIYSVLTNDAQKKELSEEIKKVKAEWLKVMDVRLQESERIAKNTNEVNILEEDRLFALAYSELLIVVQPNPWLVKDHYFLVLYDNEQRVQAIAAVSQKIDSIIVNTLLSAAWNVRMNVSNMGEYKAFTVKGAGTTLMRQVYELARKLNKKRVELTSVQTAMSFYKTHLGMSQTDMSFAFYFDVTQNTIPKALQVTSGSLLDCFSHVVEAVKSEDLVDS